MTRTPQMPPTEADPRWQSVIARDKGADGRFVYGVRTTGVFCRPSCPSRRAKAGNVTLFDTADQAEAAGFRPCLRCHPKGTSSDEASAALVAEACRLIETAEEAPTLEALAARIGMSPFHFHRRFKAVTGLTPKAWALAHRARKLREGLRPAKGGAGRGQIKDPGRVTDALYAAGYGSGSRFYEHGARTLGMTPTRYLRGGEGEEIRFALGQSSLGAILVAQSTQGICAIALGDDPEALLHEFEDRFPAARLIGGDADFEAVVAQVVGFVEAPRLGLDLPLDIRGTAFQERVWQALRDIPAGKTASYAEIAHRIGAPTAARAVAQACGANRLAVAIPCHRVLRNDGALSGYRWGVARKEALLTREGAWEQGGGAPEKAAG